MHNEHDIHDSSPVMDLETAGNGKSRKMRAGFATLAVLGLGAGITLAAWTGDVNFSGGARVDGEAIALQARVIDHTSDWVDVTTSPVPFSTVVVAPNLDQPVPVTFEVRAVQGTTQVDLPADADIRATVTNPSEGGELTNGISFEWDSPAAIENGIAKRTLNLTAPADGFTLDTVDLAVSFTLAEGTQS